MSRHSLLTPRLKLNTLSKHCFDQGIDRKVFEEVLLDALTQKLPSTENCYRYDVHYKAGGKQDFKIPPLPASVRGLFYDRKMLTDVGALTIPVKSGTVQLRDVLREHLYVVTDASNFYVSAGGQESDRGELHIRLSDRNLNLNWRLKLKVVGVRMINNCVVHMCQLPGQLYYKPPSHERFLKKAEKKGVTYDEEELHTHLQLQTDMEKVRVARAVKEVEVKINDVCCCLVKNSRRKLNTCHHSAVHLMNGALAAKLQRVVLEIKNKACGDNGYLEVLSMGRNVTKEDVAKTEKLIKLSI